VLIPPCACFFFDHIGLALLHVVLSLGINNLDHGSEWLALLPQKGGLVVLSAKIMKHSGHLAPHHPDITCPLVSLSLMQHGYPQGGGVALLCHLHTSSLCDGKSLQTRCSWCAIRYCCKQCAPALSRLH
jgi:hypothetical protein